MRRRPPTTSTGRRLGRTVAVLATTALAASLVPGTVGPAAAGDRDSEIADRGAVRIAQANLRSGMSKKRLRADVSAIAAAQPDFVTYNEVSCRADSLLTPEGYAIARPAPTKCRPRTSRRFYERSSPVAWRTDRWSLVRKGTGTITNQANWKKKRGVHLGIRIVNWVTLQERGTDRVVSVVSAHFAPFRLGLTRKSTRRLGKLTEKLRAAGPVLVGGDLNYQYNPNDTRNAPLRASGLVPTFDTTGKPSNGTRPNGQTIDYVLQTRATDWNVVGQRARPGHSDHHALFVDLEPQFGQGAPSEPPASSEPPSDARTITPGNFRSKPAGTRRERRAALRSLVRTINMMPKGATVRLDTVRLGRREVFDALRRAHDRGVRVKVLTRARPNGRERALYRDLGRNVRRASWAKRASPRARRIARRRGLPATRMMVTRSGTESKVLVHINRRVTSQLLRRPTAIKFRIGGKAYRRHVNLFQRMAR